MGRLIQHIARGGGSLHDLDVGFLFDAVHIRLAGVIGGNGGDLLTIGKHIEGGPRQGHAGIPILFHNGQADVTNILEGDGHIPGAVPLHRLHTGILLVAIRRGLLRHTVAAVGQLIPLEGDGAVKAGDAGGFERAIDLLKDEHGPLEGSLVLSVHLFDGEALIGLIRHSHILGAASGEGDVHGGDELVALRGGSLGQGVGLVRGKVRPDDLAIAVAGAGDGGAAAAGEGELGPLQGRAARAGLDNLEAGGIGYIRAAPFEGGMGLQGGVAGVGHDVGLLRGGGVIGQEQVVLRHTAHGLDGKAALGGGIVHGDTDLECPVVFLAVGVEVGGVGPAGVHLVAGGPVLLHHLQGGVVLRHEDGPLGGVRGIDLGHPVIDPGGGGGGQIHHTGVILLPVDGLLFDAVLVVGGGALQAVLVEDFHAADILILLRPDRQAGVEVFRPVGRVFQHGLDAVIHPDLLGVRGGFHQGGPASGEGCTGDGELAAGGPDRHLGGVFVLVLRQTGDAPHVIGMQLFELLQGAHGIAVGEHAHGLGVPVVLLQGQGLVGRDCRQAPVDAVGGAGESIVAGVAPTAAAQAATRAFGQVLMAAQVLDVDGAAAVQRGGAGGQGEQAGQRSHHQQQGEKTGKRLVFHENSFLLRSV